jgi:hypothetical protein
MIMMIVKDNNNNSSSSNNTMKKTKVRILRRDRLVFLVDAAAATLPAATIVSPHSTETMVYILPLLKMQRQPQPQRLLLDQVAFMRQP